MGDLLILDVFLFILAGKSLSEVLILDLLMSVYVFIDFEALLNILWG